MIALTNMVRWSTRFHVTRVSDSVYVESREDVGCQ
jgi:hypothetical protein